MRSRNARCTATGSPTAAVGRCANSWPATLATGSTPPGQCCTAGWGFVAIGFALFANLAENLIQATNIIGSIFYGVVLGLFLVAFFLKRIGGTAVFWAAVVSQALVFLLYFTLSISYLWYNIIGCALCMVISAIIQFFLPRIAPINADKTPAWST